MLLTIHNLPATTRYADIKSLLQSKCGLQQVILDNLIGEGSGKKVTVGVAEDADAAILVRKINGLYWNGQQLYVEDVRRQKSASEQPYRKSLPETQETNLSFQSMSLHQHSSYPKAVPVSMDMAPNMAVQPMMEAMYYIPDNKHMQGFGGMQTKFLQSSNQTQNMQNSFMGNVHTTQTEVVSQYNFSSADAQNRSLPWEEAYNEGPNIPERSAYNRQSPNVNWVLNESPPRERVQPWAGRGMQPDFRPNRLDDRPGFKPRSDERPGFNKPRPDVRSNEIPSLLDTPIQSRPMDQGRPFTQEFIPNKRSRMDDRFPDRSNDFGRSHERNESGPGGHRGPKEFFGQNEFSGRSNDFSRRPNERREPNDFSGRSNERREANIFSRRPNERREPNDFSGRPNENRGPNDFSARPNERRGPNDFSARPNERRGPNDFSARTNEHKGPNDFSGRPNERMGPNRFSEQSNNFSGPNGPRRPNEFSGRPNNRSGPNESSGPNQFSGRPNQNRGPNELTGRPNDRGSNEFSRGMHDRGNSNIASRRSNDRHAPPQLSERPNQRRPNPFTGRPNEFSSRPNERSNEHPGRSDEATGRIARPIERGISKPNLEVARPNKPYPLNRPYNRPGFPPGPRPERNPNPNPRKRRFEEKTEEIERPIRVSRPIPSKQKRRFDNIDSDALTATEKSKIANQMFLSGVRRIVYEIRLNLGIRDIDFFTNQTFKKLIHGRMETMLEGKGAIHPEKCYEMYRSMYPAMGDKTTYETVLAMVSNSGTVKEPVNPKSAVKAKPKSAKAKPNAVKAKPTLQPKQTKYQRELLKKQQEAATLLAQGKLPTFPQGDKRIVAQQKKEEKVGHIPEVEEKYKVAIEEELNKLGDLFIHELNNAPTARLQLAYNTVDQTQLVEEIKYNLKQHLCRRISNTGLKVVRIYGDPKLPTRDVLERTLTKFGVLSLKKSTKAKLYTASVNTYDNLDRLCVQESITVADGTSITVKPFHLAVKQRADQKLLRTMRKQMVEDMIDKTEIDLLDKDWPAREAEINAAKAADEAKAALEAEAKTSEAETAKEVKENDEKDTNEHKDGDVTETKDVTNEYVNDDFHVIDEVNESDSDIDFTEVNDVNEVFDLNSDDDGNNGDINDCNDNTDGKNINVGQSNDNVDVSDGKVDVNNVKVDESNGNVGQSNDNVDVSDANVDVNNVKVDESNGNDVVECKKEMDNAFNDDFDIDNVDVDLNDLNEDDLEDY